MRDYNEMKGKNKCGLGKEVEKVAKISIFLTLTMLNTIRPHPITL